MLLNLSLKWPWGVGVCEGHIKVTRGPWRALSTHVSLVPSRPQNPPRPASVSSSFLFMDSGPLCFPALHFLQAFLPRLNAAVFSKSSLSPSPASPPLFPSTWPAGRGPGASQPQPSKVPSEWPGVGAGPQSCGQRRVGPRGLAHSPGRLQEQGWLWDKAQPPASPPFPQV